tara:strand:+ start:119 stop:490 length:372 start_codon:yes stop_codon:yes gene_type:complete
MQLIYFIKKGSVLIFSLIIFYSCNENEDRKKIIINDFLKIRKDTLIPKNIQSYYSSTIEVNGFSNDTILIKRFINNSKYNIKLFGKIDTIIRSDYYGKNKIIFIFNPYIATKGKLNTKYSLNH